MRLKEGKGGERDPRTTLCLAVPSHLPESENENVFLTRWWKKKKKSRSLCLGVSVTKYVFSVHSDMCNSIKCVRLRVCAS